MVKATGLQKHKQSGNKNKLLFWTSSNLPSDVFLTNNLILDFFKENCLVCWRTFYGTIFSYDWRVNKGSYLCNKCLT